MDAHTRVLAAHTLVTTALTLGAVWCATPRAIPVQLAVTVTYDGEPFAAPESPKTPQTPRTPPLMTPTPTPPARAGTERGAALGAAALGENYVRVAEAHDGERCPSGEVPRA